MYITLIKLVEVDEDGMELPTNFNLKSSAKANPVDSIKEAAMTAIEALSIITRVNNGYTGMNPTDSNCDHGCSCHDTFCCVCDRKIKEDNLAYSGDPRCTVVKFKV